MKRLSQYYDEYNVDFAKVLDEETAYMRRWPIQSNTIDYYNSSVELVNWEYSTTYMVVIPIEFKMQNEKTGKVKTGKMTVCAYVQPGVHSGSGQPDYFIGSLWSVKQL